MKRQKTEAGYGWQQSGPGATRTAPAPAPPPTPPQRYIAHLLVGEGTYGFVYKAQDSHTKDSHGKNKIVAIKKFKGTKPGEGISLTAYREAMLLQELSHENIVKLRGVTVSCQEESMELVLDWAEYDLQEIIRHHHQTLQRQPPSTQFIKSLMWQLLNGINFLHSNWVFHRDLKPSNILVMDARDPDSPGMVKIADFGLARIFQAPLRTLADNGVVVTIWYRAPELLLGSRHYTPAVDLWAIGCIFAELVSTNALFPGKEKDPRNPNLFQDIQLDQIFKVLGRPTPERWPDVVHLPDWKDHPVNRNKWQGTVIMNCWDQYPKSSELRHRVPQLCEEGYDLLCKMIEYDPTKRISAAAALEHRYFLKDPKPLMNAFMSDVPSYSKTPNCIYPPRQAIPMKKESGSSSRQ